MSDKFYKEEEEETQGHYHRWLRKLVIRLSVLCSNKLSSSKCGNSKLEGTLIYDYPLKFIKSDRKIPSLRQAIECILHVFSLFIIFSYSVGMVTQYKRDGLFMNWRPVFSFNYTGNGTNMCNIGVESFPMEMDRKRYLEAMSLTRDMFTLYNFSRVTVGSCSLLFTSYVMIAIGYFWFGIVLCLKKPKLDFLSFVLNPEFEKAKGEQEIAKIFDELTTSLDHTVTYSYLKFDSIDNKHESMYRMCSEMLKIPTCPVHPEHTNRMCLTREKKIKLIYTSIYKNLLQETKNLKLVQPNVYSKPFHRLLCLIYGRTVFFGMLLGLFSTTIIMGMYILEELYTRVNQRLSYYNCSPDKTNLMSIIFVNVISKLSRQDEQQYFISRTYILENEHSEASLPFSHLWSLIKIEWTYYIFDKNAISSQIMMLSTGYFCATIATNYGSICLFNAAYKVFWLKQINRQLRDCISSMNKLNESCENHRKKGAHETSMNLELYRSITATYVNFELFRRRLFNFRKFVPLFLLQGSILSAPTIYSVNVILSSMPISSKLIYLAIMLFLFIHMNFYMVIHSIITGELEKLRVLVIRLLAASKRNNLEFCHIMNSWFRQVLTSPEESNRLFAPSLLGIPLNYRNVLALNGYLALLFCVLSINK